MAVLKEGTSPSYLPDCIHRKEKEKKNPPLLFNLAELQNECSKRVQDQSG